MSSSRLELLRSAFESIENLEKALNLNKELEDKC